MSRDHDYIIYGSAWDMSHALPCDYLNSEICAAKIQHNVTVIIYGFFYGKKLYYNSSFDKPKF